MSENIGHIYIYHDIEEGAYAMVVNQLRKHNDKEQINVHINSPGGSVREGWAIYDALKSSDKKIKTIGEGMVGSIATTIFLAGEEREITPNSSFFIHLPQGGKSGTAEEIEAYSKQVQKEESRLIDLYLKFTDTEKDALFSIMRNETELSADEAVAMGFAQSIIEKGNIFAKVKPNKNQNMKSQKEKDTIMAKLNAIVDIISGKSTDDIKNKTFTDATGETFEVDTEAEEVKVGDKVTTDKAEIVMPSGETLVIVEGEVTEIKEAEPEGAKDGDDKDEEMKKLEKEKEDLQAKLSEMEEEKTALIEAKKKSDETLEKVTKEVTEIKAQVSSYVPPSDKSGNNGRDRLAQQEADEVAAQKARRKEIKAKRKAK